MTHIIGWNLCDKNRKIAIFGCVQAARAAFFATSSLLSVSAVAQAAAAPSVNAAHSTDDTGLTDIVITAQKRSENLQRVPVSVAVVTADQLLESGVSDIRDLKLVAPGVDMQTLTGFAIPIIRGVGNRATISGVEPPNALYIDGVYYAASTANLLSFNNISQIEVLKGPQGTLFGRNATGGLMQITPREPSDILKADLTLTAANYETITGNGDVTGGIASDVVADFAVHASTMGKGYGTNLFNGKDVYKVNKDIGFRSKWLVKFGDQTEARFIGDYSEQKNSNNALRIKKGTTVPPPFGPTYGGSPWDIDADYQPLTRVKTGGVSLRIDHKIGDYSLMSLSAYRHTDTAVDFDLD
jgi:outer membrane receptor protein involved in Fe transport